MVESSPELVNDHDDRPLEFDDVSFDEKIRQTQERYEATPEEDLRDVGEILKQTVATSRAPAPAKAQRPLVLPKRKTPPPLVLRKPK